MHKQLNALILILVLTCTQTFSFGLKDLFGSKAVHPKSTYLGFIKICEDIRPEMAEALIFKLTRFYNDPEIKGVLLIINSGGGNSGVSELLFREVQDLAKRKPIVVLVLNSCCSGAYEIAIGAQWIVAPAAATIGSIGVTQIIRRDTNSKTILNNCTYDSHYELIYAGKFKALYHADRAPLTDEERAFIQAEVDASYKIFCTEVAQQRQLSLDTITDWADGKTFSGIQALERGLIDQVGGYSDATQALYRLLREAGNPVQGNVVFIE